MRIDVLMPTYHRSRELLQALDSLRNQVHVNWRAIVVDDGDGEGVRAAKQVGDPRVTAFHNPGHGQVDARNAALMHGDGDVVMLLDDDDVLLDANHMIEVLDRLEQGPALVHRSGWFLFYEADREVAREPFQPVTTPESVRLDNTILTCGLAWPRALHDTVGRFDPAMGSYYDWDWILRVLDAGVALHEIPGLGVGYRIHASNTSGMPSEKRTAAFQHFCRKHALALDQKDHLTVHREQRGDASD